MRSLKILAHALNETNKDEQMQTEIDHAGNYRTSCLHIMQHDDWKTGLGEVIADPKFPLGLNQISQISREAEQRFGGNNHV